MRCALLCKKYIPNDFDECHPQFHGLTVFTTTTVPSYENFQGFMLSTNLRTPISREEKVYEETDYIFDDAQNMELLSLRSTLSLLLENVFVSKSSSALQYFLEKGRMDYLLCYVIYYNGCDIYIHPDAVDIIKENILLPLKQSPPSRGLSFVREDMIDIVDTSEFLKNYAKERSLVSLDSKVQTHLFFPKRSVSDPCDEEFVVLNERIKEVRDTSKKDFTLEIYPKEQEILSKLSPSLLSKKKEIKYGTTTLVLFSDITDGERAQILSKLV